MYSCPVGAIFALSVAKKRERLRLIYGFTDIFSSAMFCSP
jgi:hypothetical protein